MAILDAGYLIPDKKPKASKHDPDSDFDPEKSRSPPVPICVVLPVFPMTDDH
jgi:hypothetical protein